jgi:hypothetical protein
LILTGTTLSSSIARGGANFSVFPSEVMASCFVIGERGVRLGGWVWDKVGVSLGVGLGLLNDFFLPWLAKDTVPWDGLRLGGCFMSLCEKVFFGPSGCVRIFLRCMSMVSCLLSSSGC